MSAQPAYKNSRAEEHARWRRRDHADIEAMQNLMLDEIVERANVERDAEDQLTCPAKVRGFISALQSAHGGGQIINEPFMRSHAAIAAYLQFRGSREAKEARVRRLINQLEAFQQATGYLLFHIERGGAPTGEVDGRGNPIYTATAYTDFIKPVADDAMMRARESGLYFGDKEKGIKPARPVALASQVEWALDQLPRVDVVTEDERDGAELSCVEYEIQQERRLLESIEKAAGKIDERAGDSAAWVRGLARRLISLSDSLETTRRTRSDYSALGVFEDSDELRAERKAKHGDLDQLLAQMSAGQNPSVSGEDRYSNDFGPEAPAEIRVQKCGISENEKGADPTTLSPLPDESANKDNKLGAQESAPDMLAAALQYASEGYAVFPLHTPEPDGSCSCHKKDCGSKGKHPRTARGCLDASRDPEQITKWWARWPSANIGIATGQASACIVLDIDAKNGGGAGLLALAEKVSIPPTAEVETGGGAHLYFSYEQGDVRNSASKLGEGLDVRGEGGYVVAAPSLHASGRRYRKANALLPAPVPDDLRALMLAPPVPQSNVRDFPTRQGIGDATIPEGERNAGLFRIGCAIWGKGKAGDLTDLHLQLLEANAHKCSPPLPDAEVAQLAANITARYARGVPIETT